MKVKKRLAVLFCVLILFCAVVFPPAEGTSATVYLLAVNDKLCDLPGNTLPVAVNGTIYIPYTVFDKSATGVDLGVYYGIKQDQGTILSLYSLNGILTFTVSKSKCEDGDGNAMNFKAVIRNNIPYVPAAAVCSFFGLQYSFLPTADRGTLIRISNVSISMSDSAFLSQAASAMTYRYNNILQSMASSISVPIVTPTPAATPAPSGSKKNVRVYLAVDASGAESDLTALFTTGTRVLFLFTPDSLAAQSALVRQAVALGHSVGLIVSGTAQEALEQLERGNSLLTHIARIRTRIVSAPSSITSALSAAGWSCWQPNISGTTSSAILANLAAQRTVGRITLSASSTVISRVLTQLRTDGYTLRQPLETDL